MSSPLVYSGMEAPGAKPGVPITNQNVKPALLLWLHFVTNPKFLTQPKLVDRHATAKALGLDPSVVDYFFTQVSANPGAFDHVSRVFSDIASEAGYTGPLCPVGTEPILSLAKGL